MFAAKVPLTHLVTSGSSKTNGTRCITFYIIHNGLAVTTCPKSQVWSRVDPWEPVRDFLNFHPKSSVLSSSKPEKTNYQKTLKLLLTLMKNNPVNLFRLAWDLNKFSAPSFTISCSSLLFFETMVGQIIGFVGPKGLKVVTYGRDLSELESFKFCNQKKLFRTPVQMLSNLLDFLYQEVFWGFKKLCIHVRSARKTKKQNITFGTGVRTSFVPLGIELFGFCQGIFRDFTTNRMSNWIKIFQNLCALVRSSWN